MCAAVNDRVFIRCFGTPRGDYQLIVEDEGDWIHHRATAGLHHTVAKSLGPTSWLELSRAEVIERH